MKTVAIIPIAANSEEDLELPLGELGNSTLLEIVYAQTRKYSLFSTVVTSNSKILAKFCYDKKIPFFPSSQSCQSGTQRCAEIVPRFKPELGIANILCWPLSYPNIAAYDVDTMVAKYYGEGVYTLVSRIPKGIDDEFWGDETRVKARVYGEYAVDFSRCPLPLALHHIGVYLCSVPELIRLGNIELTNLSKAERLEQLSWLGYGTKIRASVLHNHSKLPVAIRTTEQLADYDKSLVGEQA